MIPQQVAGALGQPELEVGCAVVHSEGELADGLGRGERCYRKPARLLRDEYPTDAGAAQVDRAAGTSR